MDAESLLSLSNSLVAFSGSIGIIAFEVCISGLGIRYGGAVGTFGVLADRLLAREGSNKLTLSFSYEYAPVPPSAGHFIFRAIGRLFSLCE